MADKKEKPESAEERVARIDAERLAEANTIAAIASGGSAGRETIPDSDERKAKLKEAEAGRRAAEKKE